MPPVAARAYAVAPPAAQAVAVAPPPMAASETTMTVSGMRGAAAAVVTAPDAGAVLEERLATLRQLRADGVITDAEYEGQKSAVLAAFVDA